MLPSCSGAPAIAGILFLLLFTCGCEYQPSGVFDRNIPKPGNAEIEVQLTPKDSSYILYESATLVYDLTTFGLPLYSVAFFLDDEKIHQSDDTTGRIDLEWSVSSLGGHILTMLVTTGTMSGSLADLLGGEGFIFSQSWEINFIKANPPPATTLINVKDTLGTVLLRWLPDTGPAFKYYCVYRATVVNGSVTDEFVVGKISRQDSCFCFDTTYLGGRSYYRVEVVNTGGHSMSLYIQYEKNLSNLKAVWLSDRSVRLSWTPSVYYHNFGSYRIYHENSGSQLVFESGEIGLASVVFDSATFGGENKFSIRFRAKLPAWMLYEENESKAAVVVGDPFPAFRHLTSNTSRVIFILDQNNKLKKIDAVTGQSWGSISVTGNPQWCRISPNGTILIFPSANSGYYKVDPLGFSGYEKVNLANNGSLCENTSISVSDRILARYSYPLSGVMTCDAATGSVVQNCVTDSVSCARISFSGGYIVSGFDSYSPVKCYRIDNGNLVALWTYPSAACEMVPTADKVVVYERNTGSVNVLNIPTGAVLSSFHIPEWCYYKGIDPVNPLIIFTGSTSSGTFGKLFVYNYMSGNKVYELEALATNYAAFAIHDSVIFSGAGFRTKIK